MSMSILIKGMEMPASCCQCPVNMYLCKRGYEYLLEHPTLYDERAKDCPLVHVPPHGRLIDADTLKEAFCGNCFADEKPMECSEPCMDMRIILEAPTIIPAEEE